MRTIVGNVEAVNEKGVKLDGAWYNYSKFADGLIKLDSSHVSARVELDLDKAGFIRAIRVLEQAQATPQHSQQYAKHDSLRVIALQCATQLLASHTIQDTTDMTETLAIEVISLANALLQWLEGADHG